MPDDFHLVDRCLEVAGGPDHVSPLHWDHVQVVGTYRFDEPVFEGQLRPLRGEG